MLKIAYDPIYVLPLPKGHRFPMEKYELVPQQLIHEGTCSKDNFFSPDFPDEKDILAVHDQTYVEDLKNLRLDPRAARKIGLPLSETLVRREFIISGGTIQAAEYALKEGVAMNVAGGTHHAYTNMGEGFCMFNDQAVAAKWLLKNSSCQKILIVDLDVHQGNGTAEIFAENSAVFTFSMHGKNNYPFKKEKSDLDVELEDGTGDEDYLNLLRGILPRLIREEKPDFIFYLSGVDILKTDKLGKLGCTVSGCRERDKYVLQTCHDHGIPVEVSMGGGYSPEIRDIVEAHANTFRLAQEIYF